MNILAKERRQLRVPMIFWRILPTLGSFIKPAIMAGSAQKTTLRSVAENKHKAAMAHSTWPQRAWP